MASEKVKLFSKIEIEVLAPYYGGTFSILTDLPGNAMAQRFSFPVTPGAARRPVTSRLPYNTQGHLLQVSFTPGVGQATLYRARVWARELPGGQWQWYALPVIETPIEYSPAPLPIPVTPEEWSSNALPIAATPEEWSAGALPIPPTPDEWTPAALPIKATPPVPDWVELEVDA